MIALNTRRATRAARKTPEENTISALVPSFFFAGTKIATRQGLSPVESLEEGQRVLTADYQEKEIISLKADFLELSSCRSMLSDWPILIPEGLLRNTQALVVSANQRLVFENPSTRCARNKSLISLRAETLVGYRGIVRAPLREDLPRIALGFAQATTLVLDGGLRLDIPGMSGEYAIPPLNDRQSRSIMHKMRTDHARETVWFKSRKAMAAPSAGPALSGPARL
ncbi:MAG: Hint domain-containing protein [Paracoccaceae bacterium]